MAKGRGSKASKRKPSGGSGGGGGGFGKKPEPAAAVAAAALEADAEAVLRQARGNLDAAQAAMFQDSVLRLQQAEPELFARMQDSQGPSAAPDVHEKLVALT